MLTADTDHVIGVDTHRDHHTLAVVDRNGGTDKNVQIPTDAFGYRRMLAFGREHAPGRRVWAIEGTGSFGAGLTAYLLEHEERVVEIDRRSAPLVVTAPRPTNSTRSAPRAKPSPASTSLSPAAAVTVRRSGC
jgi:hypothetical protein